MCIYVYCIYVQMYMSMLYICTNLYVCWDRRIYYIYMYIWINVCYTYVYMYICMHVYVYMYVYLCICVYIYKCIWVYKDTSVGVGAHKTFKSLCRWIRIAIFVFQFAAMCSSVLYSVAINGTAASVLRICICIHIHIYIYTYS